MSLQDQIRRSLGLEPNTRRPPPDPDPDPDPDTRRPTPDPDPDTRRPTPDPAPDPDARHPTPDARRPTPRSPNKKLLDQLRQQVARMEKTSLQLRPEPMLSGDVIPIPPDDVKLIRRETYPLGHAFSGQARLQRPDPATVGALLRLLQVPGAPAEVAPEDLLFFDLETTGLGRDTGNLPFLTGLGFFQEQSFVVEQLFLADPSREHEALERLGEHLSRPRVLVSFNGRTFDLPILRNRAIMHRLAAKLSLDSHAHLDLLPPCRRLFRTRVTNCRLKTLEKELLAYERQGDPEGSEVCVIYQEFLRSGQWGRMPDVLSHNLLDIALMAPLLDRLCGHALAPLHWGEDSRELLGSGTLHLEQGDVALGERCLRRGLELGGGATCRKTTMQALANHLRRQDRHDEAAATWERYRQEFPAENTAYEALAKYHEHRAKDLPTALNLAQAAPHRNDDVQHRLRRLHRRVARALENK